MSKANLQVLPLEAVHDRASFSCGSEPLDRYLQQQVTQDIRRRVTACFVALTSEQVVAGYYTLAATSVPLSDLPSVATKNCLVIHWCQQCEWDAWPLIKISRD